MDELTKARELLAARGWVELEGLAALLAEYGAHCAAEARAEMGGTFTRVSNELDDMRLRAEAERDTLALQVADIRKAWGLFHQFAHTFDWTDNDAGETAWENAWTEVEMAASAPTAPAVARVAAAVALAEAAAKWDDWLASGLPDDDGEAHRLHRAAQDAYRATKEAAHG